MAELKTNNEFRLPVLDSIHNELISSGLGRVSCGAPVNNGHLQIGYRGSPDSFAQVTIESNTGDSLCVGFDKPRAVEGPIFDAHTRATVTRHTTPVISRIELKRSQDSWRSNTIGLDGTPVTFSDDDRLVLSRTLAKLGDRAHSKTKKAST
jgi:hypothetical protein